jgi:hypothetical protein
LSSHTTRASSLFAAFTALTALACSDGGESAATLAAISHEAELGKLAAPVVARRDSKAIQGRPPRKS